MLSTFVLLILDEKRRGSSMGSNRNITVPTYLLGICPPHILYATRWVSLILPLESRCKSCVVYSSLTGTLMWDISCLIRALSSQRFTLLTLPFIHGLSYLLRRLTNPTFVLLVLSAMEFTSLSIE